MFGKFDVWTMSLAWILCNNPLWYMQQHTSSIQGTERWKNASKSAYFHKNVQIFSNTKRRYKAYETISLTEKWLIQYGNICIYIYRHTFYGIKVSKYGFLLQISLCTYAFTIFLSLTEFICRHHANIVIFGI